MKPVSIAICGGAVLTVLACGGTDGRGGPSAAPSDAGRAGSSVVVPGGGAGTGGAPVVSGGAAGESGARPLGGVAGTGTAGAPTSIGGAGAGGVASTGGSFAGQSGDAGAGRGGTGESSGGDAGEAQGGAAGSSVGAGAGGASAGSGGAAGGTGGTGTGGAAGAAGASGGAGALRMLFTVGRSGDSYSDYFHIVEVAEQDVSFTRVSPVIEGTTSVGRTPELSPDGGRVAFGVGWPSLSASQLYVASVAPRVPPAPARVSLDVDPTLGGSIGGFQWSPDGRRLFFFEQEGAHGASHLYLVDMSGATPGAPIMLDVGDIPFSVNRAMFVGDDAIAVIAISGAADRVFVIDVSGTTPGMPVPVNPQPADYRDTWTMCASPDQRSFAYLADNDIRSVYEVWVVDTWTGPPYTPVKAHPDLPDWQHGVDDYAGCRFSPDGSLLLFDSALPTGDHNDLMLVPITEGAPGPYATIPGETTLGQTRFARSGEGMIIRSAAGYQYVDISQPPLYDPLPINTIPDVVVRNYVLSPDTTRLVYKAETTTEEMLYLVELGSTGPGAPVLIERHPLADYGLGAYEISPDNSHVVFDQRDPGDYKLYSVDVSGALPGPRVRLTPPVGSVSLSFEFTPDRRLLVGSMLVDIDDPTRAFTMSDFAPAGWSLKQFFAFLQ